MKKALFIALLLGLFTVGCHNHDDEGVYVVNIVINKPTANQTVTKNTAMPIDVSLTRDDKGIIHNVKVEIVNESGTTVTTLLDKHYHESGTITYTEGAYKPQTTGTFKLKITATDDNKLQPNVKEVAFTVN